MRRIIYYLSIAALLCGLTSATAQKKGLRWRAGPNRPPGMNFTSGATQEQWQLQTTLSGGPDLFDVEAVSRDVAWICSGNTVYRTTDAGRKSAKPAAEAPMRTMRF